MGAPGKKMVSIRIEVIGRSRATAPSEKGFSETPRSKAINAPMR